MIALCQKSKHVLSRSRVLLNAPVDRAPDPGSSHDVSFLSFFLKFKLYVSLVTNKRKKPTKYKDSQTNSATFILVQIRAICSNLQSKVNCFFVALSSDYATYDEFS